MIWKLMLLALAVVAYGGLTTWVWILGFKEGV